MNRTSRSIWAYVTQTVLMVVTVGLGLVTTPILLRLMGSEVFGVFRILGDWMANLTILEFGLGGAIAAVLVPAVHAEDKESTASTLKEGFRAYGYIVFLMLVFAVAAVAFVPSFVSHPVTSSREIVIAGFILTVPLLFFPLTIFRTLLDIRQKSYLVNLLLIFQSLLTTALQLCAVYWGAGLIGVCTAVAVGQLPFFVVVTCYGLKRNAWFWRSKPQPEVRKRIWSVNWSIFVCKTMGRIGLQSDNLVVGQALGPSSVASFFLTQRGAVIAQNQLQGIGQSVWAGLMELQLRNETRKFELRLVELTSLVSGLGIAVLGSIALFNRSFVGLWTGPDIYAGHAANSIVCINAWMWSIFSLWCWPIDASGNTGRLVPYAIVCGILNLAVSVGATHAIGISGPLIGTLVAFTTVYSWAIPRTLKRVFAIESRCIIVAALRPLVWGIPYLAFSYWLFGQYPPNGWFTLASESALCAMGSLSLWWCFTLNSVDRKLWVARLLGLRTQRAVSVEA